MYEGIKDRGKSDSFLSVVSYIYIHIKRRVGMGVMLDGWRVCIYCKGKGYIGKGLLKKDKVCFSCRGFGLVKDIYEG